MTQGPSAYPRLLLGIRPSAFEARAPFKLVEASLCRLVGYVEVQILLLPDILELTGTPFFFSEIHSVL